MDVRIKTSVRIIVDQTYLHAHEKKEPVLTERAWVSCSQRGENEGV